MAEPTPPESPQDLVFIKNFAFDTGDVVSAPGRVTRESFDAHFSKQGFEIVDDNGEKLPKSTRRAAAESGVQA